MANIPPYPLYERTFQLYRVSPLHHGPSPFLDEKALRSHARRLRDQLKGDNVRGVEVDFAGVHGALPNLGPLEACNWDILGDENAWVMQYQQLEEPDNSQLSSSLTPDQARGVEIVLNYEKQIYNALLLRDPSSTKSLDGFTSLPLLLVKMPAPVRDIFLGYLRTTFDAHVAPLRLRPTFLTSTLESYFRRLTAQNSTQSIRDVVRQLQIQLTFPRSTTLLKSIDVTIAGADVPGFVNRGKLLAGSRDAPFTAAISQYLKKHMALDISNPNVQISKITCGGFTLSTDRLKLMAPEDEIDTSFSENDVTVASAGQLAVQDFFTALVGEAAGSGKFLPDNLERESSTPSSGENATTVGSRKRAVSTTAANNANAKRSKARGKENTGHGNGDQDVNMRGV